MPGQIVARAAVLAGETDVDVPAGIAGVGVGGKAQWKGADAPARKPAVFSHQPVECLSQLRRIDRVRERRTRLLAQPNDGLGPGPGVIRVTSRIPPQNTPGCLGDRVRKGLIDPQHAILDKAAHLKS
jgi:hypothetical protein